MASTIVAAKQERRADRQLVNGLLQRALETSPEILGIWACFEPNAFDGKDADNANKPGSDEEGLYVAHPKQERLAAKFIEHDTWAKDFVGKMKEGKAFTTLSYSKTLQVNSYRIASPIPIHGTDATWTVVVSLIQDEVLAPMHRLRWIIGTLVDGQAQRGQCPKGERLFSQGEQGCRLRCGGRQPNALRHGRDQAVER